MATRRQIEAWIDQQIDADNAETLGAFSAALVTYLSDEELRRAFGDTHVERDIENAEDAIEERQARWAAGGQR
mgnify:CR=1 FL=1